MGASKKKKEHRKPVENAKIVAKPWPNLIRRFFMHASCLSLKHLPHKLLLLLGHTTLNRLLIKYAFSPILSSPPIYTHTETDNPSPFFLPSSSVFFHLSIHMSSSSSAKLVIASDIEELKTAIAQHVASSAAKAINERGRFIMALSGGSMPQTLGGLASPSLAATVDWSRVYVLFSDERCVPLDHDDSNYKACGAALLNKLPVPAANILAIDPTLTSAEAMATDYQAKLLALFKDAPASASIPQLDTILLGMGPDGHTASLFTSHPLLEEKEKIVASITDSPKPPPERITLTFPVLNHAHEVLFIAAGSSKAALFQEAFTTSKVEGLVAIRSGLPYPAFQVRPQSLWWYTDAAGASLLSEEIKSTVVGKPKSCY